MRKSTWLTVIPLLILMTSAACAQSGFNRAYVGGSVGGAGVAAKTTSNLQNIYDVSPTLLATFVGNINMTEKVYDSSFKAALFAGYGHVWNSFYLGAEAFLNHENYNPSSSAHVSNLTFIAVFPEPLTHNSSISTTTSISPLQGGIDLRPGFLLTPTTLLYGRAGASFTKLTIKSTLNFQGTLPILLESFNRTASTSKTKSVTALRLGLGLEQQVRERISVRADYIYTYYGKVNAADNLPVALLPFFGNSTSASSQVSSTVWDNSVMISVSYYFDGPKQFA